MAIILGKSTYVQTLNFGSFFDIRTRFFDGTTATDVKRNTPIEMNADTYYGNGEPYYDGAGYTKITHTSLLAESTNITMTMYAYAADWQTTTKMALASKASSGGYDIIMNEGTDVPVGSFRNTAEA